MTKQTRWVVIVVAAVALGIFFFIVAKWLIFVLVGGSIVGWVVFATESAKAQTTPARPPTPVYHPPVQAATAEQPAPYAQGYQALSPQKSVTPGFPFGPANAEPQPHEVRPGERYEDPLIQYPEA